MKVYNQIKFEEIKSLYVMRQEGKRVDDVAVQLKRHRSTSQVVDGLKRGWSPEIIAGKMRVEGAAESVSMETSQLIYQLLLKKRVVTLKSLKMNPRRLLKSAKAY